MKSTEFCYWLQGMFEINPPSNGLTPEQVKIIAAHLNMVFYHEIDKSYPQNEQKKLDELHQGSKTENEKSSDLIKKIVEDENKKFNDLLKKIAEEDKKKYISPPKPFEPYYLNTPVCGDDIPKVTLNTPLTVKDDNTTLLMRC